MEYKARKLSLLLAFVAGLFGVANAAVRPTVSTADTTVWYMIQFINGENVLTAHADGADVTVEVPTGKATQWWKVAGSSSAGYTFVSKNGLTLTNTTNQQEGMFQAASTPAKNTLFTLLVTTNTANAYKNNWVIAPKTNTSLFMNQWGGASTGAKLGLWNDRADANQPVKFISEADWAAVGQPLPLIPYPQSVQRGEGTLNLSALTAIYADGDDARRAADSFASDLARVSGKAAPAWVDAPAQSGCISLEVDENQPLDGYVLSVKSDGISIKAGSYGGFFYALQTVRQLLPPAIYGQKADNTYDQWTLPEVEITDFPRFEWRGFHFDVSRHFFTVDEVKKLLRTAAQYKFNRFHWHLTDDQGWRIHIPEYPKLTEVGAVRKQSLTLNGGFYDDTEYGRGCFFTLEQLEDVVAYAKELNIEIMPEIDMPGHMVAAIASYPELSCDPSREYEVRSAAGISHDVLNIGKDETIDFLKCVLGHVARVFPYPLIHLGGDECPHEQWQTNADCQRRIQEEGLSNERELQAWLVQTLGTWLKENHGKQVAVWDELLQYWPEKYDYKPVIVAWNEDEGKQINGTPVYALANHAAKQGMKSIHSPYNTLYLDFQQSDGALRKIDEDYSGGWGMNSLPKIYNYDVLKGMEAGNESYMMGAQGNLWTETCSSLEQAEYQYYPRLLALAEINWLAKDKKPGWVNFYQRLQINAKALDQQDVNYAKHYVEQPEYTRDEAARVEAEELLSATRAGEAGHPTQASADALRQALDGTTEQLEQAIANFKEAALSQPKEGAVYRIRSASTLTDQRYQGSSVYQKGSNLSIHYTAQAEPEELWQFVKNENGTYILRQLFSGLELTMPAGSTTASLTETGTPIAIEAARPNGGYTFRPGAICLQAADEGSDLRVLTAQNSGVLLASGNNKICTPGTWTLEEVNDYRLFLGALVNKCRRIVEDTKPGAMGQPSAEALDFLGKEIITPASTVLAGTEEITPEIYMQYAGNYQKFLDMPRASVVDALSENIYYRIRNAYFTNYYAWMNKSTKTLQPKTGGTGDAYLFYIRKNADGTICIYNKAYDKKSLSVSKSAADQQVRANASKYRWTLKQQTVDTGNSGIVILEPTGEFSWYTNPGSFQNIILKPASWGAGIWEFVPTDRPVATAITTPDNASALPVAAYDLFGRPATSNHTGVVVVDGHKQLASKR